ncbi:MAG: hypothetical protein K9H49_09790 [Bacteroidales bacterium]|nr:hypothetical protein [Bacteroidales bacterium]MCF8389642.1 hypothetical protein [Bacteroidales bacterium]
MKRALKILIINLISLFILSSCRGEICLYEPVISISEMKDFQADGDYKEWESKSRIPLFCNQTGVIPDSSDLKANFKLAYNSNGLLFYFHIEDDVHYTDTLYPWNGDAVELFLAPEKGSKELLQISLSLVFNANGKPVIRIDDRRKNMERTTDIDIHGSRIKGVTEMELQLGLPWIFPADSGTMPLALQVYIDDSDKKNDSDKKRLTWFNNNYSSESSLSYFPVRLNGTKESFPESTSRIKITDEAFIQMKICGMENGDTLKVYHSSEKGIVEIYKEIISPGSDTVYNLSEFDIDFTKDEIYVFQNSSCVSFHDLIIAPREYIELEVPKFYDEIRRFMAGDKAAFPKPNSTLFIGSSSIRMWKTLDTDFPELDIIHRGFGGSNSADALKYINEIVIPYQPARIFYYEGDNDIPGGIENDSILKNIRNFIEIVKKESPQSEIFIMSPKPAIVRLNYYGTYIELQNQLKEMTENIDGVEYVDVASPMFLDDGKLDTSLFLEDKLHMNEKGYRIWTSVLRKKLGLDME